MLNEALRGKIEPKMAALFDEVRECYGAERCGYPYIPIFQESFSDGPRILVCGKGGGSWGLHHAGIEGIGPHTTLADVPERGWYPEVLKVQHAFVENGAMRYLSGQGGGYYGGAWLRSLYMVMVHALLGREIGERWDRSLLNPEERCPTYTKARSPSNLRTRSLSPSEGLRGGPVSLHPTNRVSSYDGRCRGIGRAYNRAVGPKHDGKGRAVEDESGRRLLPEELAAFEAAGEDPSGLSDEELMRRLKELRPEVYGHIDVDALMAVQKDADEVARVDEAAREDNEPEDR